jgi:hypothetical protein
LVATGFAASSATAAVAVAAAAFAFRAIFALPELPFAMLGSFVAMQHLGAAQAEFKPFLLHCSIPAAVGS